MLLFVAPLCVFSLPFSLTGLEDIYKSVEDTIDIEAEVHPLMLEGWRENVKVWDRILSNMCFSLSVGSFATQRTNWEGAAVRPSKEMELFSVRGHLFTPWLPPS